MHPIKLNIHWHGAAQDYVLLLHIWHHIVAPALIYMVKFKIIARNLTTWGDAPSHWGPGWHKIPGDYDTVGKAVDACREQEETLPEPWQFSITVVEFDCIGMPSGMRPRYPPWMHEFTSERFHRSRKYIDTDQLTFLSGHDIGTPPGYSRPLPTARGWSFPKQIN